MYYFGIDIFQAFPSLSFCLCLSILNNNNNNDNDDDDDNNITLFFLPLLSQSYTNNDIDTLAEVIASGDSMETTGGGPPSYQIGVTPGLSNGWGVYTDSPGPPSTNVLSVSGTETHYIPQYTLVVVLQCVCVCLLGVVCTQSDYCVPSVCSLLSLIVVVAIIAFLNRKPI